MSSEERALQVIHDYNYSPHSLAYLIAAAIDSAVAAERAELSACAHAARMPADYAPGLPAWINKLYLCYIAADDSPAQEERIERECARATLTERDDCAEYLRAEAAKLRRDGLEDQAAALFLAASALRAGRAAALGAVRAGE